MRQLLSIADMSPPELVELVSLAGRVKADPSSVGGALRGKSIGLFFMKQSVRTWVSCDVAAMELGVHTVVIRNEQVGLGSRETPEDVGRVLERYLDLLGMRVFDHGDLERIATAVSVPVVNLLSDREHPCQAVADLQTLAEQKDLDGLQLAYVGDGNNTCNSLLLAAAMCGLSIRIATPPGYEPDPHLLAVARLHGVVVLTNDPVEAVSGADAVYTDVWASMGQEAEAAERRRLFAPYRVDLSLFEKAKPDAIFLHCLPAHRGEEVTDEVIEHPRSRVFDQAENRLHSFKAILLTALGQVAAWVVRVTTKYPPMPDMPRLLGMDLRGHLDLMLLATLAKVGPAHGYAIISTLRLESEGAFDLPEGTVYPALHRLERSGLVSSTWDSSTARRRRVYRLTSRGKATLTRRNQEWHCFAKGMKAVVGSIELGGEPWNA